jgi:hypothetical protein
VLISTKSEINFRIGHNPAANGTYHLLLQPIAEPSGAEFVARYPRQALRLAFRKTAYFWGILRDPWTVPAGAGPAVSRALLNRLPFGWILALVRGGAVAVLFASGLVMLRKRHDLWPVPATVLAVMAVHIAYFASHRFSVPVLPHIYLVAALPLAAAVRRALASQRALAGAACAAVLAAGAQWLWVPGVFRVEAEALEGIQAVNTPDPRASRGTARFASAAGGPRSIAFLPYEAFPRGAYALRVHARTEACGTPSLPAIAVSVLDSAGRARFRDVFTAGDLCTRGNFRVENSPGLLRSDAVVSLAVETLGAVDVWIDRIEVMYGYARRRDVPARPAP